MDALLDTTPTFEQTTSYAMPGSYEQTCYDLRSSGLASVRAASDLELRAEIEAEDARFVDACRPRLAQILAADDL